MIDPTVKQKLALGADWRRRRRIASRCLSVPTVASTSSSIYRANKGFDVAAAGPRDSVIWRVVGNRPILEESHGVLGPAGPRVFGDLVPFPSESNRSFTPFTTPSSRSQLGGGLPVWITNIEKLSDGRIGFQIGDEYE